MKTKKILTILFVALQLTACASSSKSENPAGAETVLCVQSPCLKADGGNTFINALVTGFGAGLGWGAASAITKSW